MWIGWVENKCFQNFAVNRKDANREAQCEDIKDFITAPISWSFIRDVVTLIPAIIVTFQLWKWMKIQAT